MKPIIRAQMLSNNKCKKVKSTGPLKKEQWILADTVLVGIYLSFFVCKMPRGRQQGSHVFKAYLVAILEPAMPKKIEY